MTLRRLSPGERVSIEAYNALVDALEGLRSVGAAAPLEIQRTAAGAQLSLAAWPKWELIELDEHLKAHEKDKRGKRLLYRPTEAGDKWIDSGSLSRSLADAQAGVYLEGERRLCFFHPAAGRYIPVDAFQWHLGILNDDLPAGGSATVSLWQLTDAGLSDTNIDVEAHDWLLDSGQMLEADTKVVVLLLVHARKWIVTQAGGCPVDAPPE